MTMSNRLMRSCAPTATAILAVLGLAAATPALAGNGLPDAGPSAKAAAAAVAAASIEIPIKPFISYREASYATGGVALRHFRDGVIQVSGLPSGTQDAWLYWSYIFQTSSPASQKLKIKRISPLPAALATVTGQKVGQGPSPCWGGAGIVVYRARVPLGVATGNGSYQVFLPAAASGSATGNDPWNGGGPFSLAEGASLVLVGKGSAVVSIYDRPLSGSTFGLVAGDTFNYGLALPVAAPGNETLWDNIGADGQVGTSRAPGSSNETTTNNGVLVAGPGGQVTDSDWDGSSGWPLPQLWDDTGHNITKSTPAGTAGLRISFTAPLDCLTPVANVVSVR
jgi:hypothetical protein